MADIVYSQAKSEEILEEAVNPSEPEEVVKWLEFYDLGKTIMTLRGDLEGKNVFEEGQGTEWYAKESFAMATDDAETKTIRMCCVSAAHGLSLKAQKAAIPAGQRIATCREFITAAILHYLETGERIGEGKWFRFDEKTADGQYVGAGWRNGLLGFSPWKDDSALNSDIISILIP